MLLANDFLTPKDAAEATGFNVAKIRYLITNGRLPAANIGANPDRPRWIIHKQDLEELLTPQTAKTRKPARRSASKRIDDNVRKVF